MEFHHGIIILYMMMDLLMDKKLIKLLCEEQQRNNKHRLISEVFILSTGLQLTFHKQMTEWRHQ